jgi:hypothetical protein
MWITAVDHHCGAGYTYEFNLKTLLIKLAGVLPQANLAWDFLFMGV